MRWRHIPGREDTTATISPCMPDCFPPSPSAGGNTLTVSPYQNVTLWVNVAVPENCPAGEYPIMFRVEGHGARTESTFTLEVIPARFQAETALYPVVLCGLPGGLLPGPAVFRGTLEADGSLFFSTAAREGVNSLHACSHASAEY